LVEKLEQSKNLVYALTRTSRCYNCDRQLPAGEIIQLVNGEDEREVRCRECAKLGDLVLVPRGNQKVTRLARKYSRQHFIVLQWSPLWKSYERMGILVETEALLRAEKEV
jgi:hypothetical protein